MIRLLTRDFGQNEWTEIVSGFDDFNLLQSWEYGWAKSQMGPWEVHRAIFLQGELIVGAVQALVRTIPGLRKGLVWINRGPLWKGRDAHEPSSLIAMLEELRRHWVGKKRMYLRVAPASRGNGVDPETLENIGYRKDDNLPGWASARIDLSLPVESLRSRLQQKWRNCLNKAERLGIGVESSSERSAFSEFLGEYHRMVLERQLDTSVTPSVLSCLYEVLPPERKPWVLSGRDNGRALGSILIARYGSVCEYLAGTVNDDGRSVNAGQLLLWRALCEMKGMGYRWFDVGGMDPQRTPSGIFHFKSGLGGAPYRLMGELEAFDDAWINKVIRWRVARERQAAGV